MAMDIEKKLNPKNPFEVEMTSERYELERNIRGPIRDQAKQFLPEGMEYQGSFTCHLYSSSDLLGTASEMSLANLFVGKAEGEGLFDSCSESFVMAAVANLVTEIKRGYGHAKERTRNEKDLR